MTNTTSYRPKQKGTSSSSKRNSNNRQASSTRAGGKSNGRPQPRPGARVALQEGPRKRPAKVSSITDFSLLVKKALPEQEESHLSDQSIESLKVQPQLKQNLLAKGYEYASNIQSQTLTPLKQGRNIIGIANTGTGKTAAFLVPIIERLLLTPQHDVALVVVPTRELALQVEQEFRGLSKGMKLRSATFIGGTNVNTDMKKSQNRNHLIVGTPGRLMDLVNRGALKLDRTPILVLDEFDRMLDMGFIKDIKRIVNHMRSREQTVLFSATQDTSQKKLIDDLVTNPVLVKVNTGYTTSDHIAQDIIRVPEDGNKFDILTELLSQEGFDRILIFTETKHWANNLAKKLNREGISADQIHGNKSQNYRVKALDKFKKGEIRVMVATDVAARGIDVSDVTHVINYQLPMSYDSYVHRIGRTGRAGKQGKAYTFVN